MRKLILIVLAIAACWFASAQANAAELRIPQTAVAGQALSIGTSGNGEGTFYLIGPGATLKRKIRLGEDVQVKGEELRSAGRWVAIVRGSGGPQSQVFYVKPDKPAILNFSARPSRVPVARPNSVSGVAFIFDKFHNLILDPTPVKFSLSVGGSSASHTINSKEGVAYINSSSAPKAGAAQFVASVDDVSVNRVVEQVASDPCNLRMHVIQHEKDQIIVQTDPIRDCTGNAVPDGTIVTFTQTDSTGRSVVDARIKKGVARAQLPASNNATIAVAAGVVLGNELHVGGGQ
ncbi:MAG TPA: hypothetical protein VFR08_12405 [Candidatus Angelobacter sp.]|nr:hypothetical protein [Candidatus Angelobacter sp.]